tara:strand:+ start:1078 stop:2412 length:1335 start_codon:yes stop_codon:yes gene_type:complete
MKNSIFFDDRVTRELKKDVREVAVSASENFKDIMCLAGLDPAVDFRYSDLSYVDFSNSDLNGFDFTGSDLRGAIGADVDWDLDKVNLTDADIGQSLFQARLYFSEKINSSDKLKNEGKRILRSTWDEQIIWATKNMRVGADGLEDNLAIAYFLYENVNDNFSKGQILERILDVESDSGLVYSIILDVFSKFSSVYSLNIALKKYGRLWARGEVNSLEPVESLLKGSDVSAVASAFEFLVRRSNDSKKIKDWFSILLEDMDNRTAGAAISIIAKRRGPMHSLVARNLQAGVPRLPGQSIDAQDIFLLSRYVKKAIGYSERTAVEIDYSLLKLFYSDFNIKRLVEYVAQAVDDLSEYFEKYHFVSSFYGYKTVNPNVVCIFQIQEEGGRHFLMEWLVFKGNSWHSLRPNMNMVADNDEIRGELRRLNGDEYYENAVKELIGKFRLD